MRMSSPGTQHHRHRNRHREEHSDVAISRTSPPFCAYSSPLPQRRSRAQERQKVRTTCCRPTNTASIANHFLDITTNYNNLRSLFRNRLSPTSNGILLPVGSSPLPCLSCRLLTFRFLTIIPEVARHLLSSQGCMAPEDATSLGHHYPIDLRMRAPTLGSPTNRNL